MYTRCSDRCDFIKNDLLNKNLMDIVQPLTDYDQDQNYSRNNMDTVVNQFVRKLITLCKTTGFGILNGWHNKDSKGSVTFFGPNGMSMIHYFLVHHSQIDSIITEAYSCHIKEKYYVVITSDGCCYNEILSSYYDFLSRYKFNTLSDHTPFCFTFTIDRLSGDTPPCDNAGRVQARSVKWNEENTKVIYNLLQKNARPCWKYK